jgi:hypothetical protein
MSDIVLFCQIKIVSKRLQIEFFILLLYNQDDGKDTDPRQT